MTFQSEAYISGLSGPNPPASLVSENSSEQVSGRLSFTTNTLAEMRAISHNPVNHRCTLLGLDAAWDGLLQGDYYWVKSSEADNGATYIRPHNYQGWLWRKLN